MVDKIKVHFWHHDLKGIERKLGKQKVWKPCQMKGTAEGTKYI